MSSVKMDWGTPQEFFDNLNKVYKFQLDVCATKENQKGGVWLDPSVCDALTVPWAVGGRKINCWMNPPYGRELPKWIDKAVYEVMENNCLVVALVPARTDTEWFGKAWEQASHVFFIKGRLTFQGAPGPAPFPSALIELSKYNEYGRNVSWLDKHGVRI